jgi:uncharacterized protein
VDALLESNDGRVVGIEVKAASTVVEADFRHLKHLQKRAGDSFHLGVVFYTGDRTLPFGKRLRAVPLDALWASR